MFKTYLYNGVYWVDLIEPTKQELDKVKDAFDIEDSTILELVSPSLKPRIFIHKDYVYFVLHFPEHTHNSDKKDIEIDFIIGKDFIITARYEESGKKHIFDEMKNIVLSGQAVVQGPISIRQKNKNALNLLKKIITNLYKDTEKQIDKIKKELKNIEKQIFNHREKQMVKAISITARDIINMKQALSPHQDIWVSFLKTYPKFFNQKDIYIIRAIEDQFYKLQKHLQNLWEILRELRETNNTMLSTKQNEVMKIFTILAFVTFPLSLFASLFGMNTKYTPVLGIPYDFWVIIGMMSAATIAMFAYFRYKDWI